MPVERRSRIVVFDTGLALIAISLALPWAEVAGRSRSGPAFANLLFRLPEVALIGDHLTFVALLWYSIPVLGLATWLTQFRVWPRDLDRWSVVAGCLLGCAIALMVAWLAIRGVGFPTPGPVMASIGAVVVLLAVLGMTTRAAPEDG